MAIKSVRELFQDNGKSNKTTTRGFTSVRDLYATEENLKPFYESFQSALSNWTTAANDYSKSVGEYYKNLDSSVYGLNGAKEWKDTVSSRNQWLLAEADRLNKFLDDYGRYFDSSTIADIRKMFGETREGLNNILSHADKDIEYWKQFKNEGEYKDYYYGNKYKDYTYDEAYELWRNSPSGFPEEENEWLYKNLDNFKSSAELQAEIDELESWNDLDDPWLQQIFEHGFEDVSDLFGFTKGNRELARDEIARLTELKAKATRREEAQEFYTTYLPSTLNPDIKITDFDEYVEQGKTKGKGKGDWDGPFVRGYKSDIIAVKEGKLVASGDGFYQKFINSMDDDQYNKYAYLFGKYGKKVADKYLRVIEPEIDAKEGKRMKELVDVPVLDELFHVFANLERWAGDIGSIGSDEYKAPSAVQIADQMLGAEKKGLEKVLWDVEGNIAYMMPSMLAGYATSALLGPSGYAVMSAKTAGAIGQAGFTGLSAYGAGRQEMLNLGYSESQANMYGLLTGVSEAGLQYLLNGVGKFGGIGTESVKSFANGLNSAAAKFAIEFAIDMGGEFTEEWLQEVLTPFFKQIATGRHEAVNWGQAAYAGMLGALSAGIMNGAGAGANRVSNLVTAHNIKKQNGWADSVKKIGKTFSADTLAYKLAGKVDNNTSTWKLATLIKEMNGTLSEQNKADIKYQLMREGVTESDAKTISEWLGKAVEGENFTALQRKALDNNPIIQRVFKKVIIDQNSTVNQRLNALNNIYGKDGHAGIDYSAIAKSQSKEALSASATVQQIMRNAETEAIKTEYNIGRRTFGNYDATLDDMVNKAKNSIPHARISENGVTTNSTTGKQIDIKRVAETDGKTATYALADGSTISNKDVEYANNDEGLLYEGAISLGYGADVTNAIIHGFKGVNLSVTKYLNGVEEALEYGKVGYPVDKISNKGFYADLPDSMKSYAYNLGKKSAEKDSAKAQAKVDANKGKVKKPKTGEVIHLYEKSGLTERQTASIDALGKVVSDITHNKVYIFDTVEKTIDGQKVRVFAKDTAGFKAGTIAPNGFINKSTGEVYIDLHAGTNGEGVILWTLAHELTHFVRQWSPAKFKVLADFLVSEYAKQGTDIRDLIHKKMAESKMKKLTFDEAYEEVVADAMQTMFTDTDLASKLERLKHKDVGVWEKIKQFFADLYKRITKAYKNVSVQTEEAQKVMQMTKETIERISDLFAEGIVDAGNTYANVDIDAVTSGEIMFSPRGDVLSWDVAWDSDNHSSIKEQLKAHLDEVNSMQPVASVNYDKATGKPYYEQLDEILRTKFGYKIERKDHGSINFDKDAIKGARSYVFTDAEAAALIVAPYIIKRGKAISGHKNHKGKGYPSIVYAAPATLNGEVGNVAVSVLYGGARRVHSLRVLAPSGKEFILAEIKNTEPKNAGSTTKSGVEPTISSVFENSVSQNQNSVNTSEKVSLSERNKSHKTSQEVYDRLNKKLDGDVLYLDRKVAPGMSDTERSKILKKKSIVAPIYSGQADEAISANKGDLESHKKRLVKAALLKIGEEFKVFTDYDINDVEVMITLSRSNLKESISKDTSPTHLAKLLPLLKGAVENAIGIESHNNRYYYDTDTVYFDNLLGGYVDGEYFVPVRFGLKRSKNGITTLYVVVDQNKIPHKKIDENKKTEVVKTTASPIVKSSVSRSVTYSVSQIIPFVNSKDVLRYIPDDMLSKEQKQIKWEGIAETIKYTNQKNDEKYAKYVSAGNLDAAKQMVIAAAKEAGYTIKAYHGTDADGFSVFDKGKIGDTTGVGILGDGFYFAEKKDVASGYGKNVYSVYLKFENPYRATNDDAYRLNAAKLESEGYDGVILPAGNSHIYMALDAEQIKSADPVTYDDNGDVIPLSERFNFDNNDIRFSERKKKVDATVDKAIKNKGDLGVKYNQERISEFPSDITAMVSAASEGRIDLTGKYIAINGDDIWHEYTRHNDVAIETGRRQLPLTDETIKEAVMAIYSPDVVESLFTTIENPTQRQSFAYAKKSPNGYYIVVEVVGGRRNPNVVPVMLVQFSEAKWNDTIGSGKTLGELIHENDARLRDSLDVEFNKKNRVTVAQFASKEAIANTPRSPQFKSSVPQNQNSVNTSKNFSLSERTDNAIDNRTLLANAFESVAQNDVERSWLLKYKLQIVKLNEDQNKLAELRAEIQKIRFTEGQDRSKLPALESQAEILADRINRADKKLLSLEASKPLQEVIYRERAKAYKLGLEKLAKYRKERAESKALHYYRPRMEKIVSGLQKRLEHPTAKTAIPEAFGASVAKVLSAFNFTTYDNDGNARPTFENAKREETRNSLEALAKQLKQNSIETEYGQLDIPDEMFEWIGATLTYFNAAENLASDEFDVNKMNEQQLESAYKFLRSLQTAINNAGKYYTNAHYDVKSDATSTMDYVGELPTETSELKQKLSKMLMWDLATPITVFDRFGEGGKHVYNMLVKGQSKMAYNVQKILDFVEDAYTENESKEWRTKLVTVKIGGEKYRITAEMLMGLHCLLKQEDSRRHILEGGGIRFADVKNKGKITRFKNIFFNEIDAIAVEKALDEIPRAREVADAMQSFMEKVGSTWGNEISMIRFGYHAFTTPNYYPIRTVAAGDEYKAQQQRENIYALLNKSFTKERNIEANNAVIVDGIFSVFNNHMAEMALYNAWALPVIDTIKWFNYRETQDIDSQTPEKSVHETLRLAYGTYADKYVRDLLGSINSQADSGLSEDFAFRQLRMVNRVAVSWNARVVIQQPFSLARAYELIHPKYVTPLVGKDMKASYEEMLANSGIAKWKSMGYYDVDVSRPLETQVMKNASAADKFTETGMKGAEFADSLAWSALWNACKKETLEKNKGISNEELLKKTVERFDDIILRTQVVDSVLAKSQWMRSRKFLHRSTSAFMSEPVQSYNTLLRQADKFGRDWAIHGKKYAVKNNAKGIAKVTSVFIFSQLLNALVTAPIDAFRDDDDYEEWWEKFLSNLGENVAGNLMPLNMIPWISDFVDYFTYGRTDRSDMAYIVNLIDLSKSIFKLADNYSYYKLHNTFNKALAVASQTSGFAVSNIWRDAIAMWNAVAGELGYGELKYQTNEDTHSEGYKRMYDAIASGNEDRAEYLYGQLMSNGVAEDKIYNGLTKCVKEAFQNGDINDDEATKIIKSIIEMVGKTDSEGNPPTDDDIYWMIDRWKHSGKDGYSRYDDLYEAMENGDPTTALEWHIEKKTEAYLEEARRDAEKEGKTFSETKAKREAKAKAESAVKSAVTSYWKPRYKEAYKKGDTEEMKRIRYILRDTKLYGSVSDILNTCKGWLKD